MNRRPIFLIFLFAQIVLLGIEVLTRYDDVGRQIALAMTNVITAAAVLFFAGWLRRRGSQLSLVTFLLIAGALWLDALGNFQHLYAGLWWWDRLTHTVGGMALSAGFIDLFLSYRTAGQLQAGWTWTAWMGLLVGQLVGSVYEISEWLGDFWFATHRVQGTYDTPHDLFQNLAGGLIVLAILWLIHRRRKLAE